MNIRGVLKKIRVENECTFRSIAHRLDFSSGRISDTEKGKIPISENILRAYIREFPQYESELLETYLKEKIPHDLKERVQIVLKDKENNLKKVEIKTKTIKTFIFDTGKNGKIELENSRKIKLLSEVGISKNSIVVEVKDKYMEPYFWDGDILLFESDNFIDWESLNKRLIAVEIKGYIYIRKLIFKNAVPYLATFNSEVYPEIKIDRSVKYLCQLSELLERKSLKGIEIK